MEQGDVKMLVKTSQGACRLRVPEKPLPDAVRANVRECGYLIWRYAMLSSCSPLVCILESCAGVIGLQAPAEARTITSGHRHFIESDPCAEARQRLGRYVEQIRSIS